MDARMTSVRMTPDDLAKPIEPREGRKGPPPRVCDICGADRLYLVRLTDGPFMNQCLCPPCLRKYDAAKKAGVVA